MTMPSQSSSAPAVGSRLNGRYRIEDRIGSGGMSTVYRAFDLVLERQVAVKVMHRDIAHNPDQLERYHRSDCTRDGPRHDGRAAGGPVRGKRGSRATPR